MQADRAQFFLGGFQQLLPQLGMQLPIYDAIMLTSDILCHTAPVEDSQAFIKQGSIRESSSPNFGLAIISRDMLSR